MIKSFKKNLLLCAAIFASAVTWAQEVAPVATHTASTSSADSTMLYLLIAACAVLLIAVFMLGNVMVSLTKIALDKRAGKTVAVILLMLCTNFLFAQSETTATGDTVFQLPANFEVYVGGFVLSIELMTVIWMLITIRSLLDEISGEKKEVKQFNLHLPHIFDNINASVPIEKERDILLDHNYDGIRELDNSLPPWWKYSFYLSIIWAFFYLAYYYVGG